MGFQEFTGDKRYPMTGVVDGKKQLAENTVLVTGTYLKCSSSGNYANSLTYEFRDDEGIVGLGGGQLKYLMEQANVQPGEMCRVTFICVDTLSTGKFKGKKVAKYKLEVDRANAAKPAMSSLIDGLE